jgi:hypothetical protein
MSGMGQLTGPASSGGSGMGSTGSISTSSPSTLPATSSSSSSAAAAAAVCSTLSYTRASTALRIKINTNKSGEEIGTARKETQSRGGGEYRWKEGEKISSSSTMKHAAISTIPP